jgi:exopolysaccharide biosynthesis polyprenyl glycosylphosphotransferase
MTTSVGDAVVETSLAGESVVDTSHAPERLATTLEELLQTTTRRQGAPHRRRRPWLITRILQVSDVLGLALAFVVTEQLFVDGSGLRDFRIFVLTVPIWIGVAKVSGLYEADQQSTDHATVDELTSIVHTAVFTAWLSFTVLWITGVATPGAHPIFVFSLLSICFLTMGRAVGRVIARRSPTYVQGAVILGAGDVGQSVARKFRQHPEYGVDVVGFVDSEPEERAPGLEDLGLLGRLEDLAEIARATDVDRVVVAFSRDSHFDLLDVIRNLKRMDVQIDIVPRFFEVLGPTARLHSVEGLPLVGLPPFRLSKKSQAIKRLIDLVLAVIGLLLLLPFFAVIALLVKRDSEGPVLFRQVRMGRDERIFRIYKFRTMVADADERKAQFQSLNMHAQNGGDDRMFKIAADPRCTRVGHVLRRYSVDELPQLINVVKGEMSLVGPRPLILEEDCHVEGWARCRLDLRPGITGPWQAHGASSIPFNEMTRLDYLYVTEWSLFNDFKWIWRTASSIFRHEPADDARGRVSASTRPS